MEKAIDALVNDFEQGKLTRRDLVRGLAAVTTAAGVVSAIAGDGIAEAGTGGLEDWQEALLTGIANLHFDIDTSAGWRIVPIDEPFNSAEHKAWLFDRARPNGCLHSTTYDKVQNAVKDVPKKNTHPPAKWEVAPGNTRARAIITRILDEMVGCGAIEDSGTERNLLYELVKAKIDHACEHCDEHGMLNMAGYLYNATNDANLKAWIVENGLAYFRPTLTTDEFREMIRDRPKDLTGHDW